VWGAAGWWQHQKQKVLEVVAAVAAAAPHDLPNTQLPGWASNSHVAHSLLVCWARILLLLLLVVVLVLAGH
jgi:hypothetical protein